MEVNSTTIIGASGDYADFQQVRDDIEMMVWVVLGISSSVFEHIHLGYEALFRLKYSCIKM